MRSKANYSPELQQWLRDSFSYDGESGAIIQKQDRVSGRGQVVSRAGKRELSVNDSGYFILPVMFNGKRYMIKAHRLAYFLQTGTWPSCVDHINGNRKDNRWANLRDVSDNMNSFNRYKSWGKSADLPVGITRRKFRDYDYFRVSIGWKGEVWSTLKKNLSDAIAWRESKAKALGIA